MVPALLSRWQAMPGSVMFAVLGAQWRPAQSRLLSRAGRGSENRDNGWVAAGNAGPLALVFQPATLAMRARLPAAESASWNGLFRVDRLVAWGLTGPACLPPVGCRKVTRLPSPVALEQCAIWRKHAQSGGGTGRVRGGVIRPAPWLARRHSIGTANLSG